MTFSNAAHRGDPREAEAIRASVALSEIVGQSVRLRQSGSQHIGCCPFHPDRTPSFVLCDRKGVFFCHGCGVTGDVFDFVRMRDNVDFAEAKRRLGSNWACDAPPRHRTEKSDHSNRQRAEAIWRDGRPIPGTLVEDYLRSRGLRLEALPAQLPLRFANVRHPETGSRLHPALVAAAYGKEGEFLGIQRTFLTNDGRKAPLQPSKMTLGSIRGGAIRIGSPSDHVVVSEGLEDGLSVLLATQMTSALVSAGASNMAHILLPDTCRIVTIAADNDDAGTRAASTATHAFEAQGKEVRIMRPPSPFKDFNQLLQGK